MRLAQHARDDRAAVPRPTTRRGRAARVLERGHALWARRPLGEASPRPSIGFRLTLGGGFFLHGTLVQHVGISEDGIDLPRRPVRVTDPHLVLLRVTTDDAALLLGGHALFAEALDRGADLLGAFHFDAKMVQRSARAVPLDEHELERRVIYREVGVAVADLRRLGVEQLRI